MSSAETDNIYYWGGSTFNRVRLSAHIEWLCNGDAANHYVFPVKFLEHSSTRVLTTGATLERRLIDYSSKGWILDVHFLLLPAVATSKTGNSQLIALTQLLVVGCSRVLSDSRRDWQLASFIHRLLRFKPTVDAEICRILSACSSISISKEDECARDQAKKPAARSIEMHTAL